MKLRRRVSTGAFLMVALSLIAVGTFTWTSISQRALNEASFNFDNPGGRIHDDYEGFGDSSNGGLLQGNTNKDIYAENYSLSNIFVRVKFTEYMEVGPGAGKYTVDSANNNAMVPDASNQSHPLANAGLDNATLNDRSTWATYIPEAPSALRDFVTWNLGDGNTARKIYMPTFNQNNMDLSATVTGEAIDERTWGQRTDYDLSTNPLPGTQDQWTLGETNTSTLRTWDTSTQSEVQTPGITHTAVPTLAPDPSVTNGLMLMADWLAQGSPTGNFWVYDTDGWAYWANPLPSQEATSLLLDSLDAQAAKPGTPYYGQDMYYVINVISDFATSDELTSGANAWPGVSANAQTLLDKII